jgi:biofilm PGA synthesis N-glycosyltransferase PgaC
MEVTLGICSYNDEKNIGKLLDALKVYGREAKKIIVVASGCTDGTEQIVRIRMNADKRIELITQTKKEGKASAINLIIKKSQTEIITLVSADVMITDRTIPELLKPFSDKNVGVVGGRPIPTNRADSFCGFFVNLQWKLHHEISLSNPKVGENIAFRNVVGGIPFDTAVDEAYIEALIRKKGYKTVYAPDSVVYNRGPDNFRELITQRKRIYIGHLDLAKREGYRTSTMNTWRLVRLIFREIRTDPTRAHLIIASMILEVGIRLSAYFDYRFLGANPYKWEVCKSTKEPSSSE